MTIQNIRYQDKFNYIQQVDESLMEKHMLKLLLQPLVENAVYHGLELKVGPVRLANREKEGTKSSLPLKMMELVFQTWRRQKRDLVCKMLANG